MKPKWIRKSKRDAAVLLHSRKQDYKLRSYVVGTGYSKDAFFILPEMDLLKNEARQFQRACEMLLNWAEQQTGKKYNRGGGLKKLYEYNDGEHRFWSSKAFVYKVTVNNGSRYIHVPKLDATAGMFGRVMKLVGYAVKEKEIWNKRLALSRWLQQRIQYLRDKGYH